MKKKNKIITCIFIFLAVTVLILFNKYQYNREVWSIGLYEGENIFSLLPKPDVKTPILEASDVKDIDAEFVADPFLVKYGTKWYMFFETYDKKSSKGVISLASSNDLKKWDYHKVVLQEEFHLSYPYVFLWNNEYYMLPECGESGYMILYKSTKFPEQWEISKYILKGRYVDSSIFRYDNIWWIFSTNKLDGNLHLYYSEELDQEWMEHPKSPIVINNAHISRQGGRVLINENKIIRFTQDCYEYYGQKVRAFEINELSKNEYIEKELGIVIEGSNEDKTWNEKGMHHIDILQMDNKNYLASVDGMYYKKSNYIIDKLSKLFFIER